MIKAMATIMIAILATGGVSYYDTHYERTATYKQYCDGIASFTDKDGNQWDILTDDVYHDGQTVTLKMFTNYTPDTITDDEVVKVIK